MNHTLVGIVICTLLLTNVSAVLGTLEKKGTNNEKPTPFVFEKFFEQEDTTYVILDTHQKNEAPCGHLVGPNLAPNPSFEEGDTMPTGWTYDPNSTGIYHWDSAFAHSGMKSIGVTNITNETFYGFHWTSDFIPVDYVTNSYMLSGWFKFIGTPTHYQSAFLFKQEYDENYRLLSGGGYLYEYTAEWKKSYNDTSHMNDPEVKYVKLELGQEHWGEQEPDSSVEVRFDDIYFGIWNTVPDTPTIAGTTHGKIRTLYTFTFTTTDPNQDNVTYQINWGDNTYQTTGSYRSGEEAKITHIWGIKGTYNIKARAIDGHGAQSDWATLSVTLPCSNNIPMDSFWAKLFERFPHAFPLLRHLLGY